MPEYVYVMFSATDCAVGRFIRRMTRSKYNHVSVSLDPDMQSLYSFARYHETAPFYAGFVEESLMRYQLYGKQATVKVCRIRLTQEQAEALTRTIAELESSPGEYIYNYISALLFLTRRRIDIPRAFTCVDFAVWLLSHAGIEEVPDAFFTIHALERALDRYTVYEGDCKFYTSANAWGDDVFQYRLSRRGYVASTVSLLGKLFYRAVARYM
ncbi:MAG: hypothetical protein ACOYI5_06380 [Christensenellales bacterium]